LRIVAAIPPSTQSSKEIIERKRADAAGRIKQMEFDLISMTGASDGRVKGFEESIEVLKRDPSSGYLVKKLQDKIKKEKEEMEAVRSCIHELKAKCQAFDEALKLIEKGEDAGIHELRKDSELARIQEAIRMLGDPMTVDDMLSLLKKEDTRGNRNSIRGSVARYAREGKIFVQTGPGTFGLLELGHKKPESGDLQFADEPEIP
jgi:hypothetical protein